MSRTVLQINSDHLQTIFAHAERTYPEECCGLLLGQVEPQASASQTETHRLVEVWATENTWNAEAEAEMRAIAPETATHPLTKDRRYWIDPKEMLEAQRYARSKNLDIVGIYHSHTDHAAVPSECDRLCAWSHYSYLIVSVQQGNVQDVLSWRLDEKRQFQSEEILTVAPTSS
ncbi:M67 family metallopeptidase [Leptolyngbya sp. FACHB-671]|uniref:M67 family metallopeptidase n=1 Tax=Leptolyngbya sp. FACHB-671 TaxID=2692812 RepID=UPI001684337D|nr:M67 family metallopeptidase [Leptolyngbya sp. FACHB-671]MBD2070977.1 M67 family metallopeptidase [Leptolyngbya sp. FACHB-671]